MFPRRAFSQILKRSTLNSERALIRPSINLIRTQSFTKLARPVTIQTSFEHKSLSTPNRQYSDEGTILFPENIDINKISFGEVKKTARGGKIVPLTYNGGPLRIQIPVMRLPFGVSKMEDDTNGARYDLQFAFDNLDSDPEIKALHDFFTNLDTAIQNIALERHREWFNVDVNKAKSLIDVGFKSPLRKPTQQKYSPLLKVKIPFREGKPKCDVFLDQVTASIDDMTSGSKVRAIIECRGLWFASTQFGTSWSALQTSIVTKPNRTISGTYAFKERQ